MSDTTSSLAKQISIARDLQSVVRTMKAVAASSVGQYEKSVLALNDYNRAVELGLGACFREIRANSDVIKKSVTKKNDHSILAVVFGSDQGLVGQFNDVIADFTLKTLETITDRPKILAIGERVEVRLKDAGQMILKTFFVPHSVNSISTLIGKIFEENELKKIQNEEIDLYLFYNRPKTSFVYGPVTQKILPLDETWQAKISSNPWPKGSLAQVMGSASSTLRAFIREYLFVSLFSACAQSLKSENASRLAAMQRADKNINELLESLNGSFHQLRQRKIDEELFDVISPLFGHQK